MKNASCGQRQSQVAPGAGGGPREVRTEEEVPHEVTQWAVSRPQGTEGCFIQKTQHNDPPPPTHTHRGLAQVCVLQAEAVWAGGWPGPCGPGRAGPRPTAHLHSPALPLGPPFSSPNTVHSLLPQGLCTGHAGPPTCASPVGSYHPRPPSSDSSSAQRALISLPACISRLPP